MRLQVPAPWAAALTALLLAVFVPVYAEDDEDAQASPVTQHLTAAGRALEVPAAIQKQAGIEVARPELTELLPESEAQGRVVDIAPLLEHRWQYREAVSEVESAGAASSRAKAALDRMLALRRNPADVSARQMLEIETARDEQAARLRAAESRRSALQEGMRQQWGAALAERAMSEAESGVAMFANQVLLLIVSSRTGGLGNPQIPVMVSMAGDRSAAAVASPVGAAPAGPANAPGDAWFYLAPSAGFRVGAHVRAWVPESATALQGVLVPRQAVIWHAGQPWLYLRTGATEFARQNLSAARNLGSNWFVADAALAGREIVVSGAQTLLSEEQRAHIPDEDDDP